MSRSTDSAGKLDSIVRALNLLPYFQAHPDRSLMEAAKDLGRDPAELQEEINRLRCCGVGTWPEELVDLEADWTRVSITNSQGMDRPLRLTPTEAGARAPPAARQRPLEPALAAFIQAEAAIDIGDTLVGMHIRPVAVPLRIDTDKIGHANLVMAYSRLPYIGGSRAVYE